MVYAPHVGARVMGMVFPMLGVVVLIVGGVSSYTYPRYVHLHLHLATTRCVYLGIAMAFVVIVFASLLVFCGHVRRIAVEQNRSQ